MGALDYLSNFCTDTSTRRGKRKTMQTVEIKVKMDCDGCERKVRNSVSSMKGVKSVELNRKQSRVTVTGYVEPNKVLKRVKNTGKKAEFWPYVPYNLVTYPYVSQAYDKRAPSGYVKNAVQALPSPNNPDERLATLFSDDNPNACSIMWWVAHKKRSRLKLAITVRSGLQLFSEQEHLKDCESAAVIL